MLAVAPGLKSWFAISLLCFGFAPWLNAGNLNAGSGQSAAKSWTSESAQAGRTWIERMSRSMQDLTYTGSFVYLQDGELEAMRIYHTKVDSIEYERLSSLNGEAREIIRDADSVVCIWPGTKSVIVNTVQPRTPFPHFDPDALDELESHYRFGKMGMERVAGRTVEVIDIIPLDGYRYGYRLWVDAENFMLLRSAMSDSRGQMVEQVMFTDISYPSQIPLEMFSATTEGNAYKWFTGIEGKLPQLASESRIPGVAELALPDGFSLMSDEMTPVAGADVTARRVLYSDGLASLSVFITDGKDESGAGVLKGATAMGAVHAYGVMRDNWHATVVGEVPHAAIKMIAESLVLAQH